MQDREASPAGTKGLVLEIQRLSTEDGPGIRSTVFLKGCPMRCLWCHNPESIAPRPQAQWVGARCIACGECLRACPRGALSSLPGGGVAIDRGRCESCGACAEACPSAALELLGSYREAGELARELLKDREYFGASGGGITLSGGEATSQWRFSAALLAELKAAGIHTALDSCGAASRESLDALLPLVDLVLYDLKESDPARHLAYTGYPLEPVLRNLEYLAWRGAEIWVRTPIVPGATARADNVEGIGAIISDRCGGAAKRWDLLAFNNLCKDKYRRLGQEWALEEAPLIAREEMESLAQAARGSVQDPSIVRWSGATRLERI